jgi:Flp pilus assembly protein TadD
VAAYVAAHPDSLEARQLLATELLRDGKLADAKIALDAGLAKDPNWLTGYRGLGILAVRAGKPEEALAAYDRALAIKPDAVEFKLLAASLLEKKDKAAAEARYRDVLATNPAADVAANNLAVILAADGKDKAKLEEALVLARRFENSGQPFFADTYAWILYMQGDYAKAATVLDRVVKAAPAQAIFRYHLGAALYQTKDLPGAKLQLAQAEKLAQGGERFEGYEDAMAMLAKLH